MGIMRNPRQRTVAVIGAGFSGTLAALLLLAEAPGLRVVLLERAHAGPCGCGVAYSTTNPNHLLNVPAGRMSALADRPLDFLEWLGTQGHSAFDAADFVPRSLFGRYIADRLDAAIRSSAGQLELVRADVRSVRQAGGAFVVETAGGLPIRADQVVLATGNAAPPPPRADAAFLDSAMYRANPWADDALTGLPPEAPVLVLGTGLTMVDTVVSLLDLGHRGPIHAVSRRGLVPRRHVAMPSAPCMTSVPPATFLALLQWLRSEAKACQEAGLPWQVAVDWLRPHTQAIWRAASPEDRGRFLRHLRPWWDVHRHRIAPHVADRIDAARSAGQLRIHAGRTQAFALDGEMAEVSYRPRGEAGLRRLRVARVINCTGPAADVTRSQDPLFRSLLADGLARPDMFRLGLDVTGSSAVIGRDGRVTPGLFALGPLTRGAFWEVTAVPDIRQQCAELAGQEVLATAWPKGSALHPEADARPLQPLYQVSGG